MDNIWHSVKAGDYPPLFKDVYVWFDNGTRAAIGRWLGGFWTCNETRGYIYNGIVAWQDLPEGPNFN